MKNILLVFTGGTIGSQPDNGTIDTHSAASFKLVQLFQQQFEKQSGVSFKTLQPAQILSENLHPRIWQNIIAAIEAEDLAQFDGIIITHGTDTLAFSAALLGLYFHALKIPMLLVSSDLPLDNPAANGLHNFTCAVEFIRQNVRPGVFVPYQNPGQTMQVHIATRLGSCLPLSSDFMSARSQTFMSFANGHFSPLHELADRTTVEITLKPAFGRILLIKPYPGLDYANFNPANVDAILHDLYHSGTACASPQWGDNHNLIAFGQHCRQLGIPLYMAPAIHSETAYSSTRQLLAHGMEMIWNTSLESAYAKLVLAYGNFRDPRTIGDFLATDIAGEHVQPLAYS